MGVSGRSPQRHRPAALEARCRPGRGRPAGRYPGDGAAPVSAPPAARADSYFDAQGLLRAERVRADFPILGREVHGRPLVYLDSAASSQQPRAVLEATEHYATSSHANVHRGVHTLSQEATVAFEAAHARGVPVLLDGAQAIAHQRVDVQQLDCDFYAFSGHKMYAPTGIGVLYGRESLLAAMPPWQGGGDMILSVSIAHSTYNALPWKFEAGTPKNFFAVGLGPGLRYLDELGRPRRAVP